MHLFKGKFKLRYIENLHWIEANVEEYVNGICFLSFGAPANKYTGIGKVAALDNRETKSSYSNL